MKKFKGYYIIGAINKKEAEEEKGLMLWSQNKPSVLTRFFNRLFLRIYWIDKEKMLEKKQDLFKTTDSHLTKMPRFMPAKTNHKNEYANER
jgi:hypothetical protein